MASLPTSHEAAAREEQFLTFYLADEEYAIRILQVKEIIEYDRVTKVPSTPAWIRGVINLRGAVVPVVDLAAKFGLGETRPGKLTCIVVVESELDGRPGVTGLMVDAVSQVVELKDSDIEAVPAFGTKVRVDYLAGMGKAAKRFVLLLDIERVLAADELLTASAAICDDTPAHVASAPATRS